MAFAVRDLSVLAYANGFTMWHYKTGKNSLNAVRGENFFGDASDMMAVGDMVLVSGAGGATVLCVAATGETSVIAAPLG